MSAVIVAKQALITVLAPLAVGIEVRHIAPPHRGSLHGKCKYRRLRLDPGFEQREEQQERERSLRGEVAIVNPIPAAAMAHGRQGEIARNARETHCTEMGRLPEFGTASAG